MNKRLARKELDHRVSNLRERFGKLENDPLNDELIDVLFVVQKGVTFQELLANTEKPFCLECLSSVKLFFPMFLIQDSDEFCCKNCGITIPRLSSETSRPTENPEVVKRRELFYNEEKEKKSYMEIERLLTKYEAVSPKKKRVKKKSKTPK